MAERLHKRFYYELTPYYSVLTFESDKGVFLGLSLANLGLERGPPWYQMGADIVSISIGLAKVSRTLSQGEGDRSC